MGKFLTMILLCLSAFALQAQISVYSPALPFTQKINSKYNETSPVLHPSGKLLYFTRANHPQNVGGITDQGDIWVSEADSTGRWSEPVHGGRLINDTGRNTVIGFLNQGSYLLLGGQYGDEKRLSPDGIAVSKSSKGKWLAPENVTIPYFKNKADLLNGSVSADGEYLILSMESFRTYGVEDLYVSERNRKGEWGELKNLGKDINTTGQEISGMLTPGNRYLVFATNGRKGYGSYDLWISERKGNSWTRWKDPVLMSDLVNSSGADTDFTFIPGGEYAFFTSSRNSDGYGDIKQVKMETDSMPEIVTLQLPPDTRRLDIVVKDAESGEGLLSTAEVFSSRDTLSKRTLVTGGATFIVPDYEPVTLTADAKGYVPVELILDMRTLGEDSLVTIALERLEVGKQVRLANILFERASDRFLASSDVQLQLLLKMMQENPSVSIFLEGHTDSYGNARSNRELSARRVKAVKDFLVQSGIAESRIDGEGYGGTRPIADNNDPELRKLNRRVEFRVTAE